MTKYLGWSNDELFTELKLNEYNEEILSRSLDPHNQHTPLKLCEEIVEKLIESKADLSGDVI